ncbi:uncharacterized protein BXIN_1339 [Babesia sp. Xinjiang]|uniref:uncharacterized protein n=1 Tax=Babesia sp. Xinjiang TaxID=462227 RepID=UPI000A23E01D|nr:uncharacterized protein BXIN_1339 [Babesia sp. Xinjiang]ORM40134.1 hypothetical protein BXIN_1339 [Babesia sp. Xinjiang]
MTRQANSDSDGLGDHVGGSNRLSKKGKDNVKSYGLLRKDALSALWKCTETDPSRNIADNASVVPSQDSDTSKSSVYFKGWYKTKNIDSSDDGENQQSEEPEANTYTTVLYNKLSSMFDGFKGLMYSNWNVTHTLANEPAATTSDRRSPSISQRFNSTMDSLLGRTGAADRFVAFIANFTIPKAGFNFSNPFVPRHDKFVDCFALFIEGKNTGRGAEFAQPVENAALDVGDSLRCEIVSKVSQQVISKYGPYHCVFEEEVDSQTRHKSLRDFIGEMSFSNGRLRFFQAIKSFRRQSDKQVDAASENTATDDAEDTPEQNGQSAANYLKNRLGMLSEYLSRRSDDTSSSTALKSYFQSLRAWRSEDTEVRSEESADYRLKEHTMVHSGHWDEYQYDNIEIILRDDNNNPVIKLPYGCAVM